MKRGNISNRLAPLVLVSLNLLFKPQSEQREIPVVATSVTSLLFGIRPKEVAVKMNKTQEFDMEVVSMLNKIYVKTDFSIGIVTIGLTEELVDMYRKMLRDKFIVGRVMNFDSYIALREYLDGIKNRVCFYVDSDDDARSIVGSKAMTFEAFKTEI